MPSPTWKHWFQQRLAWSSSRQSWQERIASLLLLVAAGCLAGWGRRLSLAQQVVLWGLLGVALALLLRRGWLKLLGPVLFYDLMRTARRGRYILVRCLYAAALFFILWSLFLNYRSAAITGSEAARFAESFFTVFMYVQLIAVGLLTPAYTAGAIAEEKERKTLEFLLATDLRNREIVLSKLASRLANLTLIILTGLPILSMVQFLGGVDPDLVLAGFAATGLTMLSLASLSILNSVYARKARDAIILTYLTAFGYLAISGLSMILLQFPNVANQALSFGSNPFTVHDLIDGFTAGNILVAMGKLSMAMFQGNALAETLPGLLRDYAIFHGLVTAVCSVWAVVRLRRVAVQQAHGKPRRISLRSRLWRRPPIGERPMVWKEVYAEPGLRFNLFGRLVIGLIVIVSFVPAAWIIADYVSSPAEPGPTGRFFDFGSWDWLGIRINGWVRTAGTVVATLMLLFVAVRAASSISGERDRQTFDSLLTSPLDSSAILYGKWLGSLLSVRWWWLWLGLIWMIGLVCGALNLLALPVLVLAWAVYAGFLAVVGLWFSITCRSTLRATIWTLVASIMAYGGHWLLWLICCIPFYLGSSGGGSGLAELARFQAMALTPPAALAFLAFQSRDFERDYHEPGNWLFLALFGLLLWGVGTLVFWAITVNRFEEVTSRSPYRPSPARRNPWA